MRTVLEMDEKIIELAKLKAIQQGKSLDALVEEGLRLALQVSPVHSPPHGAAEGEALEANDPFFIALEEVRNRGRKHIGRQALSFDE